MRASHAGGVAPAALSRSNSNGDSCFLTTACCELVGLDDDCFELTVLRRYRDTVLPRLPGGRGRDRAVLRPGAVRSRRPSRAARRSGNSLGLYFTHILPCVALACLGFREATRRRYRDMLVRLARAAGVAAPA